ncbi:DUF6242 domain-containing protein [uncultured Bacteroides sp.]|uniref:DUF6242 domain-containing protein n=1 Tax=uncultured Bacteroides sp. TaxID=162156 RepID=UPI002597A1CD|nr:DUF6242 domain-containing protein [uncultured Bacteroides sp.]
MKIRILPSLVAGIMTATFFLSSCLGNDYEEIEYPSTSSITSFSIGTLHQTFYVKSSEGEDSVYTDTISYADVPFTIDQINRKIYNKDSLPKGVDITRVVASISADYAAVYYVKNNKDTIWTTADSLDFSKPVTFKVMTFNPTLNQFDFGASYEVSVNVHKLNPDSLVWKHFENNKFANNIVYTKQKAVYTNESLYVFGETADGSVKANKTSVERGNISSWNEITLPAGTNIYSATAFNNNVYFVANGELYFLENQITKVGNFTGLTNLITVSNGKLLAYKGNENKVVTIDSEGNELTESNFVNGNNLNGRMSAISMPSSHNKDLWRTIVMTNNIGTSEADSTATVFSYISNDTEWVKYQPNNPTTCPNQGNISMITYDGKIYAFGEDFDYFYTSNDNGLNWNQETGYMVFPSENKNGIDKLTTYLGNGSYSAVVEENGNKGSFIWFIWEDGSATRALLNRLTPKE